MPQRNSQSITNRHGFELIIGYILVCYLLSLSLYLLKRERGKSTRLLKFSLSLESLSLILRISPHCGLALFSLLLSTP
jgi:hypothetical protein